MAFEIFVQRRFIAVEKPTIIAITRLPARSHCSGRNIFASDPETPIPRTGTSVFSYIEMRVGQLFDVALREAQCLRAYRPNIRIPERSEAMHMRLAVELVVSS